MEDQEEKEGNGLIANVVQMIILFWSLVFVTWASYGAHVLKEFIIERLK